MKLLLFIAPLLICLNSYGQSEYYFANTGDDNSSGKISSPFKTIDKLNKLSLKPGDKVYFRCGDIFTGQININASGTKDNLITFDSYGQGDKPVISGSLEIKSWKKLPGKNIWQASLNKKIPITGLYINSVAAPLSRYPQSNAPNKGYLTVASHLDGTQLTSKERIIGNWVGAELVYRPNQWALQRCKIISQEGNTLTIKKADAYDIADGWGFFIQNQIDALNNNGDWCIDTTKNTISLYYTNGNPNDQKIEITYFSAGVSLINCSNILLQNLVIDKTANYGVYASNATNLTINNLKITNSGENAISIVGARCNNIVIENNYINHSNNNGVYVYYVTNFKFINNTIKNTGLIAGRGRSNSGQYTALDFASPENEVDGSFLIQGNKIDSVGYNGICFWASNALIKNNVISNFCLIKSDGGGIYTSGLRKNTKQIITANIVLGSQVDLIPIINTRPFINGIYLDDCAQDVIVSNNTLANCTNGGIFLHGSKNIDVHENTCYNNNVQYSLNRSASGCDNINISTHQNIFFSGTINQPVAIYGRPNNANNDYGNFSNNYYISPDTTQSVLSGFDAETKNSKRVSLGYWKSKLSKDRDSHSLGGPEVYNKNIKFMYNTSPQPEILKLDGKYKDIKNNVLNGSITIQPYSSVILLETK